MAKQHIELLKAVGLPEDKITALEGMKEEELKDWKPDELVGLVKTGIKSGLLNDAEFLASIPEDKINKDILRKIESGQYARFQNELVEVATKKLGLEDKELTAEDRKSIKGLAEKMAVTYLAKKGNVEGLAKMQTDLQEAQQNLETLKNEHKTNLETELKKVNTVNDARVLRTLARVEIGQLEGVTLSVAAKFVTDPVLNALTSKYALVLGDNDEILVKQKDNPALDVMEKGKKLSFVDVAKQVVIDNKLGAEVKADDPNDPKNKKIKVIVTNDGGGGGGNDLVPSYIKDKIDNNPDLK